VAEGRVRALAILLDRGQNEEALRLSPDFTEARDGLQAATAMKQGNQKPPGAAP
jgi:hypothetical protein